MSSMAVIRPLAMMPKEAKRKIYYPQYVAEVTISIPRLIGRPRVFRVFLLADGCVGKVVRCDIWPDFEQMQEHCETVTTRIEPERAKNAMQEYAIKRIARRYHSYWQPEITIDRFQKVYKIFWVTNPKCVVDSVSNKKMRFRGQSPTVLK